MSECKHQATQGRDGHTGSWCMDCGIKVWEVDPRECGYCQHSEKLIDGWICRPNLMGIIRDMHVYYEITKGSCWTSLTTTPKKKETPL